MCHFAHIHRLKTMESPNWLKIAIAIALLFGFRAARKPPALMMQQKPIVFSGHAAAEIEAAMVTALQNGANTVKGEAGEGSWVRSWMAFLQILNLPPDTISRIDHLTIPDIEAVITTLRNYWNRTARRIR